MDAMALRSRTVGFRTGPTSAQLDEVASRLSECRSCGDVYLNSDAHSRLHASYSMDSYKPCPQDCGVLLPALNTSVHIRHNNMHLTLKGNTVSEVKWCDLGKHAVPASDIDGSISGRGQSVEFCTEYSPFPSQDSVVAIEAGK